MSEWFYAVAREQRGPVDEQGIRTLIAEGTLQGNSPVWKEGLPQWVRLDKTDLSRFLVVSPPLPDESATEEQARPEGQAINLNLSGLPTKFQHEYTTDSVFGLNTTNLSAIGSAATRSNIMAMVALALAIAGFFTGVTFFPAIVCGHIARSRCKRDPTVSGGGMALAALIMSYVVVGPIILFYFLYIVLIATTGFSQ